MAQPGKRPCTPPDPRIKTPLTRLPRATRHYNSAPRRILIRPRSHGKSVPRLRSIVIIWGRIGAAAIGLEITVGIVKAEAVFGDVGI